MPIFTKITKFCLYYSIIPFLVIRILSNIVTIVFYNLLVFGPLDAKTCLNWTHTIYGTPILWVMGYTSSFIPTFVAFIVLYVIDIFGSKKSCCDSSTYQADVGSQEDKEEILPDHQNSVL